MAVGGDEKLCVALAHDNSGTCAWNLILLRSKKPVLGGVEGLIINGHNGRHSLLHNGRHIISRAGLYHRP